MLELKKLHSSMKMVSISMTVKALSDLILLLISLTETKSFMQLPTTERFPLSLTTCLKMTKVIISNTGTRLSRFISRRTDNGKYKYYYRILGSVQRMVQQHFDTQSQERARYYGGFNHRTTLKELEMKAMEHLEDFPF